jgi:hypothetical protein
LAVGATGLHDCAPRATICACRACIRDATGNVRLNLVTGDGRNKVGPDHI